MHSLLMTSENPHPMRTLLLLLLSASPVLALEPKDVFIVANKDSKDSLAVAEHYCAKRKVPQPDILCYSQGIKL